MCSNLFGTLLGFFLFFRVLVLFFFCQLSAPADFIFLVGAPFLLFFFVANIVLAASFVSRVYLAGKLFQCFSFRCCCQSFLLQ